MENHHLFGLSLILVSQRWYFLAHQDGHFLNRSENPGVPSPQNSLILLINSGEFPNCGVRWNHHFFPVSHNFRLDTQLFLCRRHLQIWFLRKTYQQQKDTHIELFFIRNWTSSKHHQTNLTVFSFPQGPLKKETVNHNRLSHYGPGPEIHLIDRWFPPPWWLLLAPSPCLCWRWHSSRRCLAYIPSGNLT